MCYNYDRENVRGGINMLNYRKIEPADDKALAELIRANLGYYHLDIAGTVYFDPELDHMSGFYNSDPQKRVYFTALDEAGHVIGGAGVAEFSGIANCAELQKLYLSSTVRGRGYGKELLRLAESWARSAGYKNLYLETHTNLAVAIKLYEREGFRQIGKPASAVHGGMDRFYLKGL